MLGILSTEMSQINLEELDTSPNSPVQVLRSLKLEALWCLSLMIYSSDEACKLIILADIEFMEKGNKVEDEFMQVYVEKSQGFYQIISNLLNNSIKEGEIDL